MAARAAPPELVGFRSSRPSYGGMWACRPTAFGGGAAESGCFSGGYSIRPYGCTSAGSRCRGAFYMRPGRTTGISGPSVIATRAWRHGGMPPYGVRRGCGGKCRLFGRICNPPLQVRSLPFPAVGAHYICARDALPGPARSAGYGENRSAARAAIKAAPTGAPAGVCRCRSSERERLPLRGAVSRRLTERCYRTNCLPLGFGVCNGR